MSCIERGDQLKSDYRTKSLAFAKFAEFSIFGSVIWTTLRKLLLDMWSILSYGLCMFEHLESNKIKNINATSSLNYLIFPSGYGQNHRSLLATLYGKLSLSFSALETPFFRYCMPILAKKAISVTTFEIMIINVP